MRLTVITFLMMFSFFATADQVKIVGWNLGGFYKISKENLRNIKRGAKEINAHIFVLTEVNPENVAHKIAAALSDENCSYSAVTPKQKLARQKISIIYHCDVSLLYPIVIQGSNLGNNGYRNIIAAHVKIDKFDFVIVGLHLKSSRGPVNRDYRTSQLRYLSGYIQGIYHSGEKDVVIVGDYNMIPGDDDENFNVLNSDGSLRFVSTELPSNEYSHIYKSGNPGNLLDGYGFSIIDKQEYVKGSVEIIKMHEILDMNLTDYRSSVTDHLPIIAEFMTSEDYD